MDSKILRCVVFLIFISNSHSLFFPPFRMPKSINFLEETLVHNLYANCTKYDIFTSNYTLVKLAAAEKIALLTLTQYVGAEKAVHKLNEAHTTIPASPLFDPSKPTVIFVHAYMATFVWPFALPITNELLNIKSINFFMFEHNSLVTDEYAVASSNARVAGDHLGEVLSKLYANGVKNFHCIGYSLGAHTCGFTGKMYTKKSFQLLDRISGIDPAGPCFFFEAPEYRLDSSDAKFVDIMHTDMNAFAIAKSIGHVDFYPNGGENMLGCVIPTCSHAMASFYYGESIKSKDFLAVKCSDWETFKAGSCANNERAVMGFWTLPNTSHGDYYLFLNPTPKFSLGEEGIAKPGFNWRKFL